MRSQMGSQWRGSIIPSSTRFGLTRVNGFTIVSDLKLLATFSFYLHVPQNLRRWVILEPSGYIDYRGGDLKETAGTVPSKILGEGDGTANSPPKFEKYLIKYKFIVFSTAHTGSYVV